jgi:type II secretory pathway component PulC
LDETAAETARRYPATALAESKQINDHDWYIGTDELARLEKEGEALLNEIELSMTVPKSEKRPRLQMKVVPEGSLAHQRGFRNGDILRTINGEEMSQKSTIISYIKANPRQSTFAVEIERLGSRVTKVFTLAR